MRGLMCFVVVCGTTAPALAGFMDLSISRQIKAGALLADDQTSQDSHDKQNSTTGLWADAVQGTLARNTMTVNSQSSQASRVMETRFNGNSRLTQFARTLDGAFGRSTGSSEYLIHFRVDDFVNASYAYDFSINLASSDQRYAHAQFLLYRLDDNMVILHEQIADGHVSRAGDIALQPAHYAFLVESQMLINSENAEMHDGSVTTSFDFKMIPSPGAASLACLSLAAARRRRG